MALPYDRSAELTPENHLFESDLDRFVMGAYHSDMSSGDVTTAALADYDRDGEAVIVAKSEGVFCGRPAVEWFLERFGGLCQPAFAVNEGLKFGSGTEVLYIKGKISDILKIERTVLNVLQRLCGIAAQTARFVALAKPAGVAATRKTTWGLLDKYAVAVGGGLTHRLNLGDAVLFKENHWVLAGSLPNLILSFEKLPRDLPFVTIEAENAADVHSLLKALPDSAPWPVFLMLDNFSPVDLESLISSVNKPDFVHFEASGGINLENIEDYAQTGAEVLSVGALTHSVPPVDLSLRLG